MLSTWSEATGLDVRDGFGQTETGQLTANLPGEPARPGSMGRPLPGVKMWVEDGELVLDPATSPTFFLGYRGEPPHDRARPGAPATASSRTRTATSTSRAAPTT